MTKREHLMHLALFLDYCKANNILVVKASKTVNKKGNWVYQYKILTSLNHSQIKYLKHYGLFYYQGYNRIYLEQYKELPLIQ